MRAATLALALLTPGLIAADWPSYLGPARDGRAAEDAGTAALVRAWKAGSLTQTWRRAPGRGYGAVSIAEGRAYVLAEDGGQAVIAAMDAATGRELWRTPVGPAWKDSMGYDGPRATPTLADGRVVVWTGRGVVAAADAADGTLKWKVDVTEAFAGSPPKWGYSGSPLVHAGLVYLDPGGPGGRGLAALRLADGTTAWTAGDDPAGYASPVHARFGDTDAIVFFTGSAVAAVTPASGEPLWSLPWATNYGVNAAVPQRIDGGRLLVGSGYGTGAALLQVAPDARSVSTVWRSPRLKTRMATAVIHEGHAYGFNEDVLVAMSLASGEVSWQQTGLGRGTLILAEGHLVVLDETCDLHLALASPKAYKEVAKPIEVLGDGPCWTAPAVADGRLFVRDTGHVVALAAAAP